MIKCAIFDMDGTLVNSMYYWTIAAKEYIESLSKKPEDGLSKKFLSISLPESCVYMKEKYNIDKSLEEIAQGIDDIMDYHYMHDIKMKPYMKMLVKVFYKMGIKMAVASSTDKYLIYKSLKRQGIDKYFDYVISSTEVGCGKSKPDIYLKCSDYYNLKSTESIVFEDLPYGIISSKKVGFKTVGLYDEPSLYLQDMIKENADIYIKKMNIFKIIKLVKFMKQE